MAVADVVLSGQSSLVSNTPSIVCSKHSRVKAFELHIRWKVYRFVGSVMQHSLLTWTEAAGHDKSHVCPEAADNMNGRPTYGLQSINSLGQPTALQGYEADRWTGTVHEGAAACALQLGPQHMLHQLPGRHSKLQKAMRSHMQLIALPAVKHLCENTCALILICAEETGLASITSISLLHNGTVQMCDS